MNGFTASLLNTVLSHLPTFVLLEIRFTSILGIVFFLRREWIPVKIIILFCMMLSFFILNDAQKLPSLNISDFSSMAGAVFHQFILGIVTGIILNFFAEFFIGFGQVVSMQAGLGFVNFYVPRVGSITPVSQFFSLMAIAVFWGLNGHLIIIKMLVNSFTAMPDIPVSFTPDFFENVLQFSGILFKGITMLSISVIFSVMLTNITLAVMTKFTPQLNLFSIGINISLLMCFFILYISFDLIVENGEILFNDLMKFITEMHL